ncbi:MAG: NAD(P)H-quinone oxidoreductase [Calditrichia bacterium]
MLAVEISAEKLVIADRPRPDPASGELLVKVHAAGVNRADVLQRQGLYPPPPGASDIPGLEIAGQVYRCGREVNGWEKGQRVMALLPGGGYAGFAVVDARLAMPVPQNLSFEDAAGIPEVFLTAYQAIRRLGDLQPGEQVLIHAGGSGVGTAAIQLCRAIGATPIITAGSAEKISACKKLGAMQGINYHDGPFLPKIMEFTGGAGVDMIIDFIGEPYWEQNLQALKTDGRLIFLAMMGGSRVDKLDLKIFMKKRLRIMGSTLRNRSLQYKINLTADFAAFALPLFEKEILRPVIDRVFPVEKAADAHRYMEENRNTGKIILQFPD